MPGTSVPTPPKGQDEGTQTISSNGCENGKHPEEEGEDQFKPFPWQKPVPSKALRTSENYMLKYKCRKRPGGGKVSSRSVCL